MLGIKTQFLHLPCKRFFLLVQQKLPMYETLNIIQNFIHPQVQILKVGIDFKR
jgi:hypothetical protein